MVDPLIKMFTLVRPTIKEYIAVSMTEFYVSAVCLKLQDYTTTKAINSDHCAYVWWKEMKFCLNSQTVKKMLS